MFQSNNVIASMVGQALHAQENENKRRRMSTPDGRRQSIIKLRETGATYKEIAKQLHVSRDTIRAVLSNVESDENPIHKCRTKQIF